jgi:V8-like Glu-specific endopeptidase
MTRSLWRSAVVLAVGGLAFTALAVPGDAARPAVGRSVVIYNQAETTAEAKAVAAKWTPAAMRSAIPMDTITLRKAVRSVTKIATGAPQVVRPTAAKPGGGVSVQSFPNGGGAWTGGGAVTHTIGRVFFTFQGRRASCSGDAVTSGNKSVVLTAGHCVKLEGAFHTDWVFVPGYNNGNAPFGTWAARQTMSTPQWVATEDINFDVGAAVVNPLNGQRLTDVVGAQGVAFNQARGQRMYAFGYPAAAPYDGTKLIYCSGTVINDFLLSNDLGMSCDMTGGASGGPWFLSFNEGTATGIQNSINSFRYQLLGVIDPGFMFGPYFGADAQNLYNAAAAA